MENYESIDKALNISETDIVPTKKETLRKEDTPKKNEVEKDYEYTRANLYSIIEKGQEAINGIMEVAGESASPRAYEVALAGIKNVADTVDKLQDLQAKLKELKQLPKTSNANIKNALFVGSTAELQKMLNRKKEDETIKSKNITPEKTDISD